MRNIFTSERVPRRRSWCSTSAFSATRSTCCLRCGWCGRRIPGRNCTSPFPRTSRRSWVVCHGSTVPGATCVIRGMPRCGKTSRWWLACAARNSMWSSTSTGPTGQAGSRFSAAPGNGSAACPTAAVRSFGNGCLPRMSRIRSPGSRYICNAATVWPKRDFLSPTRNSTLRWTRPGCRRRRFPRPSGEAISTSAHSPRRIPRSCRRRSSRN